MLGLYRRFFCALAMLGLISASAPAFAQPANGQARFSHSGFASVLHGNSLIVIGGLLYFEGESQQVTANYKIELASGESTSISTDVIFSRGNAAALVGDIVYVSGGSALVSQAIGNGAYATGFSDAFAAYNIATNSWVELPDLPTTAIGHCSFAHGGNVYIVGGQQERSMRPFQSPYVTATRIPRYSIADRRWSTIEAPEGVLSQYAACVQLGNEYFLIGGYRDDRRATKDVWVWNFEANTWRRGPDLPNAVGGAEATVLDGAIYVAGGAVYSDIDGTSTQIEDRHILRLSSDAQAWETVGEISAERGGHAMISWNQGIFLIGGRPTAGPRAAGLWIERIWGQAWDGVTAPSSGEASRP